MNKFVYIFFLLAFVTYGQTALYNGGNLRIHEGGQIGFHTNLINDGPFDENSGRAGFYGNEPITLSGALMPVLFDIEIMNPAGVILETALSVSNNTNFMVGDFISPRAIPGVHYGFLQDAFFVGEGDASKIDGYAQVSGQQNFSFPVGDSFQLRPLVINSNGVNSMALCAYFFEDPNSPSTFPPFNTAIKPRNIFGISTTEFWRLEGSVLSRVTLSWNSRSNLAGLTADVNSITVMGWSKTGSQWVNLGRESIAGDIDQGIVSSAPFVPDDFEVLTFGSADEAEELLSLDDFYLSPNADGVNDFLFIPELAQSPNNRLEIYDRRGLKVFEMDNYQNEFEGISNVDNLVLNRGIGLPEGLYFYIISMFDLDLNFQGFLFLDR